MKQTHWTWPSWAINSCPCDTKTRNGDASVTLDKAKGMDSNANVLRSSNNSPCYYIVFLAPVDWLLIDSYASHTRIEYMDQILIHKCAGWFYRSQFTEWLLYNYSVDQHYYSGGTVGKSPNCQDTIAQQDEFLHPHGIIKNKKKLIHVWATLPVKMVLDT